MRKCYERGESIIRSGKAVFLFIGVLFGFAAGYLSASNNLVGAMEVTDVPYIEHRLLAGSLPPDKVSALNALLHFYASQDIEAFEDDLKGKNVSAEEKERRLQKFKECRDALKTLKGEMLEEPIFTYDTLLLWVARTMGTIQVVTPRRTLDALTQHVLIPLSADLVKYDFEVTPEFLEEFKDYAEPEKSTPEVYRVGEIYKAKAYERTRKLIAEGKYREPYDIRVIKSFGEWFAIKPDIACLHIPERPKWLRFYFNELQRAGQEELLKELKSLETRHFYSKALQRVRFLAAMINILREREEWYLIAEIIDRLNVTCVDISDRQYGFIGRLLLREHWQDSSRELTLEVPERIYPMPYQTFYLLFY